MSTSLVAFSVNKESKSILVKRKFAGELKSVWEAWTNAEILDKWWAPKPWKTETKFMNFSVGGQWLYAMVSSEGEKHWSVVDYMKIIPLKSFSALDGFSVENGKINLELPRAKWQN